MAGRIAPFRTLLRPIIWHNHVTPSCSSSRSSSFSTSHTPLYAKQRQGYETPQRAQATWDDFDVASDWFNSAASRDHASPSSSSSSNSHAASSGHLGPHSRDAPPHLKRQHARSSPIDPTQLPLGTIPKPQKQVKFRPANKYGRSRRNKAPPPPALPPVEPVPNVADLDPVHFSELRLWTLRRSGVTPTTEDLQRNLFAWLTGAHKAKARAEHEAKRSRELHATKRDALDLSWEWDRQVAVKSGVERTDREKRRDEIVLRRLERRRLEKLQLAKDREREERAELDELIRKREDEAKAKVKGAADAALREAEQKRQADEDEAKERLKNAPDWKKHQVALREQFPDGWAPPKRLSREAMDLIRTMHAANPTQYSTAALADQFKVSPEAVRRILKSRFQLSKAEADRREAKRKEARKLEAAPQGSSVWGGNIAAEAREMESIRSAGGSEGGASSTTSNRG